MGEYYYIVASLPLLRWGEAPPITHHEFLEVCDSQLGRGEREQIQWARLDPEEIPMEKRLHPLLLQWAAFENTIRNELVRLRAEKTGRSGEEFLHREPGFNSTAFRKVKAAAEHPSPYEAEIHLLRIRWEFLSGWEVGHTFDLTALIRYCLQLQILERMSLFDARRGHELLERFYERIPREE
jgi:hypothetical protein